MNLIDTLDNELKDKHYNDDEKVRYIYLRVCEMFSFDLRWYYASYFKDYDMLREVSKPIDPRNIDRYEVICHHVASSILKPSIEELTSRRVNIMQTDFHTFSRTDFMGDKCLLDPIGTDDMSYVKMGMETSKFSVYKDIEKMDEELGYTLVSEDDFKKSIDINKDLSLFEKHLIFASKLDKSKLKYHFNDTKFFISKYEAYTKSRPLQRVSDTYIDDEYNFYRLIHITNEDRCLEIKEDKGVYRMEEIPKELYLKFRSILRKRG